VHLRPSEGIRYALAANDDARALGAIQSEECSQYATAPAVSFTGITHMPADTLDHILDVLHLARQRATYGAVASALGKAPRTLMKNRERDQRHSWVVSAKNGLPTGYEQDQLHPDLLLNDRVIETRDEMAAWLLAQEGSSPSVAAA
jgi:hypothetical protein